MKNHAKSSSMSIIESFFTLIIIVSFLSDCSFNKKIIAFVDDEPVYLREITNGMPEHAFNTDKEKKAKRIASYKALKMYLDKNNISVDSNSVNKKIEYFKAFPPHRPGHEMGNYTTFDEFLRLNYMTEDLFRFFILTDLRLEKYLDTLWKAQKNSLTDEMIKNKISELNKEYDCLYHIFVIKGNNESLDSIQQYKIKSIYEDVMKNSSFENTAKNMSEDNTSKDKGGYIGVIRKYTFGPEAQNAISNLTYGEVSGICKSEYGYHIFRKKEIEAPDLLEFLQKEFLFLKGKEVKQYALDSIQIKWVKNFK